MFVSEKIADDLIEDLRKLGEMPELIRYVKGKGNGTVYAPKEITKLIRRDNVLKQY